MLAVVAGLTVGVFVAPLAAHASNHDGWCDNGEYCMNEDINWSSGFHDEYSPPDAPHGRGEPGSWR